MFSENVSAYFDSVSGFALDATFDPSGANTAVKVIFDQPYLAQEGIGGSNPTVLGKVTDFANTCIGKTLVVNSTNYVIRRREFETPDGTIVRLQLEG
jgi:hypothetical protein